MPYQFSCPECKAPVISFMRPGEHATCKRCGRRVEVPGNAIQVDQGEIAAPPPGATAAREPEGSLSPEAERLVAIGRQLPPPTYRLFTLLLFLPDLPRAVGGIAGAIALAAVTA
jgi:hypothetical protein